MKKFLAVLMFVVLVAAGASILRGATHSTVASTSGGYVALGDSVAAGLGLGDSGSSGACGRTTKAYSAIVASSINKTAVNLSCSGATMTDVTTKQLDQLFAQPQPSVITVTIGANDLQWTKLLAQCYKATCGSAQDTQVVTERLAGLQQNLNGMLATIHNKYPQNTPRVVLTGYYQVLPANKAGCPKIDELTDSEISWWHTQENNLNKTIADAAHQNSGFTVFAPVDYTGHDICQRQGVSWIQGLGADAPFHPSETGQEIIAGAVVSTLQKVQ